MDQLARDLKVVRRKRKFTGRSLVRMLVLTLVEKPKATYKDWALTAAQLGTPVSETAVEKRFTEPLAEFLKAACQRALREVVAADPAAIKVFEQFTAVIVGDSTSIALPDDMAAAYPGCGNASGGGKAALKLQVRWDLKTGALPQVLIEAGKASDCKSPIAQREPLPGSVEIFDLGYFEVARFRRLDAAKAFWVSRFLHGTHVFTAAGRPLNLRELLAQTRTRSLELPIQVGEQTRLPCRLIAIRAPEDVANRRRQHAREKARAKGRDLTEENSELLGWSLYVTNLPPDRCDWKTIVVLYRSRWQIELLFKQWKSHNQLATHRRGARTPEVMTVVWAKLMGVIVQHWLLLMSCWNDPRRSLMKAARAIGQWMVPLITALDQPALLKKTLKNLLANVGHLAKVQSRSKHPSHYQLLENPALLDWAA